VELIEAAWTSHASTSRTATTTPTAKTYDEVRAAARQVGRPITLLPTFAAQKFG